MHQYIEYIAEKVYEYYLGREIVLWGKCVGSDNVRDVLREKYQIDIAFYIDSDTEKIDERHVMPIDRISGMSSKYYIVVPLAFNKSIREYLNQKGYRANQDYYYFTDCAIHEESDYYEDAHNNRIIGRRAEGLKVAFLGFNSVIEIGEDVCFYKTCVYVHNDSKIVIGDHANMTKLVIHIENQVLCQINEGTVFTEDNSWHICDNAMLKIGRRGRFEQGFMAVLKNAHLVIGEDFYIGKYYRIFASEESTIHIGDACLFSYNIEMRTDDGHSIFDIETGENINSTVDIRRSRNIIIGKHVWVGSHSVILYNAKIEDGSIIGAMSLVKKSIPNNCIAAGIPAKVIRKNVAWCRKSGAANILQCGEDYVHFTKDSKETQTNTAL